MHSCDIFQEIKAGKAAAREVVRVAKVAVGEVIRVVKVGIAR